MLRFDSKCHDAVVFDCDGTLVDSMPLHHEAWCAAFRFHHAPFEFDWNRFVSRAGMTLEETVIELNREFGCLLDPAKVSNTQRKNYAKLRDNVTPIHHVVRFAESLRGKHPMAVASGSSHESVHHALSKVGIWDWFDVVVTAADVRRGKPAPDGFLLAANRLGVPAERCLVVEDGAAGIEAARLAQMDAFLVTSDGNAELIGANRHTL